MIKPSSQLYIIDNSGGRRVHCIKLLKKSPKKYASIGDLVLVTIKTYRKAIKKRLINKNSIYLGLIVSTKKKVNRVNGLTLSSLDNNIVLLSKDHSLIGKRIRGTVFVELREKGFSRIATVAENVL
jgi:large subunit ribosomal protein L14